ncbi:MAG: outer membrane beta-barrel protein [Proteobacteria bacterium]|nr:outer membrane beta-barrel protein [Pseudomonadota bacterium]
MRLFLIAVLMMILFYGQVYAENADVIPFEPGLSALFISVTDENNPGEAAENYFPDIKKAVGLKYFLDRRTAVEGEATFLFMNEEKAEDQEEGIMLGLAGAYIQYIDVDQVSPYLKYGGRLTYLMGDAYERNDDDDHFFLEARIGFGVEYFITREFSVGAEALASFQVAPTVVFDSIMPSVRASFYFDDLMR